MHHKFLLILGLIAVHASAASPTAPPATWPQWRGPTRDGLVHGAVWPDKLTGLIQRTWRAELGPSYSGPIVSEDRVFVTEAKDKRLEIVRALDRKTGKEIWRREWEGYGSVPFFARSNGDWIRATPAFADGRLYVAGMRDVLVCLDAADGKILWRVDFPNDQKTPVPSFGFVSSPLVMGDAVYVQAGAAFVKLDSRTGKILWRTLADGGGMWGSAFSSPVLARIGGEDQLLVQTRDKLGGVAPADGKVLWEQPIAAFRGMNILTPSVAGDRVFSSAYGGKTQGFDLKRTDGQWRVTEAWSTKLEGYMSTPVVLDGHAYLHLRNQKFAAVEIATGQMKWTTDRKFGKYWSLVANGKRLLALDEDGTLRLIELSPKSFQLLDSAKVSDTESWAHLAVSGGEFFIRDLKGISAFSWGQAISNPE